MNNSNDSSNGVAAPVDYAPPRQPQRFGKTPWGSLALGLAIIFDLPVLLANHIPWGRVPVPPAIYQWNGEFISNFAIPLQTLVLALAVLGLFQRRFSRNAAVAALALTLAAYVLVAM